MNRLLRLILLCLLASLALAVAACGGGGDGDEASSDTDVDTLLADTFNGKDKKIESGKLKFRSTSTPRTPRASAGRSR